MIDRILISYVTIPPIAYGLHMFSGVLSVGSEEVSKQHNEFVDSAGYGGLILLIWSVGLIDLSDDSKNQL